MTDSKQLPSAQKGEDLNLSSTDRVLQNRQKKNKKLNDEFNRSFDKSGINNFMMSDSIIEENKDTDGYLETDRQGDDLDEENNFVSKSSGKKYDMLDTSMDADSSIMIIEESICEDLDESGLLTNRSTLSPASSPRKTPVSELNGGA